MLDIYFFSFILEAHWHIQLLLLKQYVPSKVKVKVKSLSRVWLFATSPWNSPGQNTGVGSLSLLQGIFPSQGSNPGLQYCRGIQQKEEPLIWSVAIRRCELCSGWPLVPQSLSSLSLWPFSVCRVLVDKDCVFIVAPHCIFRTCLVPGR